MSLDRAGGEAYGGDVLDRATKRARDPLGNRRALYPLISLPVNSGASWLKASSGGQVGVASLLS